MAKCGVVKSWVAWVQIPPVTFLADCGQIPFLTLSCFTYKKRPLIKDLTSVTSGGWNELIHVNCLIQSQTYEGLQIISCYF